MEKLKEKGEKKKGAKGRGRGKGESSYTDLRSRKEPEEGRWEENHGRPGGQSTVLGSISPIEAIACAAADGDTSPEDDLETRKQSEHLWTFPHGNGCWLERALLIAKPFKDWKHLRVYGDSKQ